MPDHTQYETGARRPVEKTQPDENDNVSQDAATNKRPPFRFGNSIAKEDVNEKTRHSDGRNPSWRATVDSTPERASGSGPVGGTHPRQAGAPATDSDPDPHSED